MPKLDLTSIPQSNATGYPDEHAEQVQGRWCRRIARAAGLTELGATHVVLKPGAWSSHRHWHDTEDEMLVMLSGEAVLVEDEGRAVLRAGDICAWPKGVENGHHVINESDTDCCFIALSGGERTTGGYSDIDMMVSGNDFLHRDGTPFPPKQKA